MSRQIVYAMSLATASTALAIADEATTAAGPKPQWQRLLEGDEARKAFAGQLFLFLGRT